MINVSVSVIVNVSLSSFVTVFAENSSSLQIVNDFRMLLKGTSHLFPRHKLRHLLGQLPKLFKVYVPIRQPMRKEEKRQKRRNKNS